MIFPYWELLRGAEARYLPLVPVTILGDGTGQELLALVDSGAEHNIFPTAVARQFALPLDQAQEVLVVGAGDHQMTGHMARAKMRLGRQHWTAPVIFSDAASEYAILGQMGLFAFFTVTFRYGKREVEIRRSR